MVQVGGEAPPVEATVDARSGGAAARRLAGVAIAAVVVAGFEPNALWWSVGSVQLRSGQVAGLVAVGAALGAAVLVLRGGRGLGRPLIPGLLLALSGWLVASWIAADIAPSAVTATSFRLLLGVAVGVAMWIVLCEADLRQRFVRWLVIAYAVGAVVGLAAFAAGGEWWFSDALRGAPTELGPYQRLTRPFNHANVAAMAFAPVAVLAGALTTGDRRWWLALGPIVPAVVLTYSRMAPVALVAGLAVAGYCSRRVRPWALVGAFLVGVTVLTVVLSPAWSARLGSPGQSAWYGVGIETEGPDPVTGQVLVGVENRSTVEWGSGGADRVELSLRWRNLEGTEQFLDERFSLPAPLAPGDRVVIEVATEAWIELAPGDYELIVDIVRDREAFFGEVTGDAEVLQVRAESAVGNAESAPVRRPVPQMARSDLWRAAWSLIGQEPWFGVGNGNYRLLYGAELGLVEFSRSSHAHSLYLEPAASSGVPAAGLLVALLAVIGAGTVAARPLEPLDAGLVGALATMATHGLVDWPLIFTASGTLFFALVGGAARAVGR